MGERGRTDPGYLSEPWASEAGREYLGEPWASEADFPPLLFPLSFPENFYLTNLPPHSIVSP